MKMSDVDFLQSWSAIRQNLSAVKASAAILLCACIFGIIEFLLWGRTHWEEGAMLMALLLLGAYDLLHRPLQSVPSPRCRFASWFLLLLAGAAMMLSSRLASENGNADMWRTLCKNIGLFLLATALSMHFDGAKTALSFLPLLLLSTVILPLYEYLLLEFSYPMRLVSTAASALLLRLCMVPVNYVGTTFFWNDQAITITDACSGISLLSLLFFLEYLIARKVAAPAWEKWCWGSLLLIWIILGNALRQLLTFALFQVIGEKVYEQTPHFLLGCLLIVITSLLIWFSSFLFHLDTRQQKKE